MTRRHSSPAATGAGRGAGAAAPWSGAWPWLRPWLPSALPDPGLGTDPGSTCVHPEQPPAASGMPRGSQGKSSAPPRPCPQGHARPQLKLALLATSKALSGNPQVLAQLGEFAAVLGHAQSSRGCAKLPATSRDGSLPSACDFATKVSPSRYAATQHRSQRGLLWGVNLDPLPGRVATLFLP